MSIGKPNEVAERIIAVFGPTTTFLQAGGGDRRNGTLNPSYVPRGIEGLSNLDLAEQRWGFPRPRINPNGDRWHAAVAYSETQIGVFSAACQAAWSDGWFESRLGIPKSHASIGPDRTPAGFPDFIERVDLAMTKAGEEILGNYGKVQGGGSSTRPSKPLPPSDPDSKLAEMMDETRHPFWARSPKWDKPEAKGHEDYIWEKQWEWLARKDAEGKNIDELQPDSYGPGFQPSKLLAMKRRLDLLETAVKEQDASAASAAKAPTVEALRDVQTKMDELSAAVALLTR